MKLAKAVAGGLFDTLTTMVTTTGLKAAGRLGKVQAGGDLQKRGGRFVNDEVRDGPKQRKKGTKAAKALAAARGIAWGTLTKRQKGDLRLLARAERGSLRAAVRLFERLGIQAPSPITPSAPVDVPLAKAVLPGVDAGAAAGALAAIKAALRAPHPGASGWR